MFFDMERLRENIREAETEDLLNRVTVYRSGMEPLAVDLIEGELQRRGVTQLAIDHHAAAREDKVILLADGVAASCNFCHAPAVARGWGWHRLFRRIPLFPRMYFYCESHRPEANQ